MLRRRVKRGSFRNAMRLSAVSTMLVSIAGACHRATPTGQVLATVGGKDITLEDIRAEGRADGVPPTAGRQADLALLERVIDRDLLAQSAHQQKLDQTPEAPADLARVELTWMADKAAKRLVVGIATPTEAQAQAFIATHPYAFAKRERVLARTLTIAAAPPLLTQLKSFKSYDQALGFLKRLGVAMSTGHGAVDTAQLSDAAAAQLAQTPVGALLVTQPPGRIQVAEVESHSPVVSSPADDVALAKQALAARSANDRIATALVRLKTSTAIKYQAGYGPPAAAKSSSGAEAKGS